MYWVGVRYRGIALPDIMSMMRIWLDQRGFNPKAFEVAISGSGTLVCVEFTQGTEAAEFAKAFAGSISRDRPRIDRIESLKANEIRREENAPGYS